MQLYSLVDGKKLPEVYRFGFNGTHFEIFLKPTYWLQFVNFTEWGTEYALRQGEAYVPPVITGGPLGQDGCAFASKTFEGFTRIRVPAFVEKPDDENELVLMRTFAQTLSGILSVLQQLLFDADEQKEEPIYRLPQLFSLETYVASEPGHNSMGLDLSLSPFARKYLEHIGEGTVYYKAVEAMKEHYWKLHPTDKKSVELFPGAVMVCLRENGVLHINTVGESVCLGTIPENFGDERGCHLCSNNVDTVSQQFNLLVGVAYVWSAVYDGFRIAAQTVLVP